MPDPRLTVLHAIGQLGRGGSERQLLRVVGPLAAAGVAQTVVTFDPGGTWDGEIVRQGIALRSIARDADAAFRARELGAVATEVGCNVVHSWSAHTNVYLASAPLRPGTARVMSLRWNPDTPMGTALGPGTRALQALALGRADAVTSNTAFALAAVARWGVVVRHGVVIRNVLPAPAVEVGLGQPPRSPTERPGDRVRLVVVGSLTPVKGVDTVLEAVAAVAAPGPDRAGAAGRATPPAADAPVELVIVGDGPERARLEAKARELGLVGIVRWAGAVDDPAPLVASADIAVHGAHSEGLANAILEAMAAGLPVVATAVGGTPEIVDDGRTGLLVPPRDAGAMAAALRRLIGDRDLRRRLGDAGAARVAAVCSTVAVRDGLVACYRAALLNRG